MATYALEYTWSSSSDTHSVVETQLAWYTILKSNRMNSNDHLSIINSNILPNKVFDIVKYWNVKQMENIQLFCDFNMCFGNKICLQVPFYSSYEDAFDFVFGSIITESTEEIQDGILKIMLKMTNKVCACV